MCRSSSARIKAPLVARKQKQSSSKVKVRKSEGGIQMAKGRDGLYRRENGILAFRYKDENEKWRERYTGTTDRKRARDIREQFLRELKEGTLPTEMADWRLDQARQWWLEFRKCRVSPGTLTTDSTDLNR